MNVQFVLKGILLGYPVVYNVDKETIDAAASLLSSETLVLLAAKIGSQPQVSSLQMYEALYHSKTD